MKHWNPDKPARPARMERWIFVNLLVIGGASLGLSVGCAIMQDWTWTVIAVANGAFALGYATFRTKESGWP